ncbi:MAG: PP2C family serine/threonine-protein phosphatase [candidate division WOR-3 bacterium]
MRLKRCPRCNTLNSMESKRCLVCDFDLNYYFCFVCGTRVEEGKENCDNCGTALKNVYYVPERLGEILVDKKYKVQNRGDFWTTVYELNPNITKIQVASPVFQFFSSFGNLYDAIEVEKGKYLPVINVAGSLKSIASIWASLGEESKIDFLLNFAERLKNFSDLYFTEKINEFLLDEKFAAFLPVSEEKKKGFVSYEVFLQKLLHTLKGIKNSLWEKEKQGFLQGTFSIQQFVSWLKALKARLRIPVVKYAGISNKGPVRSNNEDAILILEAHEEIHRLDSVDPVRRYLFILSDGLGGHERGEVAAGMIIEGMRKEFYKNLLTRKSVSIEDVVECVEVVNNFVYSENMSSDDTTRKMGGTISGVFVDGNNFTIFNVGDSPIFIFSDATYYEASQRDVSQKKAKAVTQAIGVKTSEELNVHAEELKTPADEFRILICSDGLTDVVPEDVIYSIVMDEKISIKEKCDKLIEEAYRRKTSDNVSIILIEVEKSHVIGSPE